MQKLRPRWPEKDKTSALAEQWVYAYYKAHRSRLPKDFVSKKRTEIVALVMQGVGVAEAFNRFADNRS